MDSLTTIFLSLFFFAAAILYSSVGHAGASAYQAVMALFGVAPATMKATALALNSVVASVGAFKFYRAGFFSWRVFVPFALGSIPFAFIGGQITLSDWFYKVIVGVILLFAAYRMFAVSAVKGEEAARPLPIWIGVGCGIGIGLLSGLTGVGGGIFLSPLLILMRWADAKMTAGAGLAGNVSRVNALPSIIPLWMLAVLIGGLIGAEYGSRRFGSVTLKRLLALVLLLGGLALMLDGVKLLLSGFP
ncbi:MAG: sulfite exporter TauE/SafE family protein [Chloroflexi bacterium]|nr:sulfite exporter TauE/SafE family protein [Chloroflexota bacterium]